jgi:Zn-dependent protease
MMRGFKAQRQYFAVMGTRDGRADLVDDDPFSSPQKGKIHRIHQRQSNDGTIHFQTNPQQLSGMFSQLLGNFQQQPATMHDGRIWHFSKTEKEHLALAMGAFTIALGLMQVGGIFSISSVGMVPWTIGILLAMPVMFIAIGPAFLLHEIGHKIIAKKNGCWAEFRADPRGLKNGVLLALLLGIVFMAPGAVMVAGLVTRRQNGHIAVAGPLVNLSLFLIGIPLWGAVIGITGAADFAHLPYLDSNDSLVWQAMVFDIGYFWLGANLFLGLFNMLPFGPLDGLKVKDWNESVFYLVLAIFALPIIGILMGLWGPTALLQGVAGYF